MTIPLKNPTVFSKAFSCICSECKYEFVIVVNPTTVGEAICPKCESTKIFVQADNDDFLFA